MHSRRSRRNSGSFRLVCVTLGGEMEILYSLVCTLRFLSVVLPRSLVTRGVLLAEVWRMHACVQG